MQSIRRRTASRNATEMSRRKRGGAYVGPRPGATVARVVGVRKVRSPISGGVGGEVEGGATVRGDSGFLIMGITCELARPRPIRRAMLEQGAVDDSSGPIVAACTRLFPAL